MFNKILIANRGEIACRIIKTAKMMGIQTVAVYSTADKNSLHVSLANEAYCIGEPKAQASYLNIDAIIACAKASQCEAIHPGYGFLSENPAFAKACLAAKITFIGPSVEAMQAMASKQLAKQLLEKTQVPLTPGYHGNDQTDAALLQAAKKIGFPVLLKAANGGGGKGMRSVLSEQEFAAELASARRESKACFADETLIIEKLVTNPRHIEVQIMADNHGQVVHLFERDCSLQRRHQKIIEEAPAPTIDEALRSKLTKAACDVARSINYRGAGTVEFLVDDQQHFYFMEMNTRLQVEHPVTEMITGTDLVAWQIKIAANEPLPLTQEQINKTGHAIECRIYAEDPLNNFLPSVGKLHFLSPPTGDGIRIDSGVMMNAEISPYYDPMIAKLIAWGETRAEALQRLEQALSHYAIGGVKTNIAFLRAIIAEPVFMNAKVTTDFLSKHPIHIPQPSYNQAILCAAVVDYLKCSATLTDPLWQQAFAWQSQVSSARLITWRYVIENNVAENSSAKRIHAIQVKPCHPHQLLVIHHEQEQTITASYEKHQLIIDNGQEKTHYLVHHHDQKLSCYFPEGVVIVDTYNPEQKSPLTPLNQALTSPMPATIVAILKNKGDAVKQGERLIVLEAMKMEHTIYAPADGLLTEIYYDVGAQVPEGVELLALTH